jgi:hypothetical protein
MLDSTAALPRHHEAWIAMPSKTSHVGVFVKSLHLLAASWVLTIAFLYLTVEPTVRSSSNLIAHAMIPSLALVFLGLFVDRSAQPILAGYRSAAQEWTQAVAWTVVPALFLAGGVAVM